MLGLVKRNKAYVEKYKMEKQKYNIKTVKGSNLHNRILPSFGMILHELKNS